MTLDLVLVVGYFRSATPFLSLVRHLSGAFKVGMVFTELNASLEKKTGDAHRLFVELCTDFGATIVQPEERIDARLMVVQQFPYEDAIVAGLLDRIAAREIVGMLTLASAGLEKHDRFLMQFGLRRAFAPDAGLVRFLLERRNASDRYDDLEVVEVGLPFDKHPVFGDFQVDWLIAAPTLFSFHSEAGKQQFLRCILDLMAQMPATDRVAYKSHNGSVDDYFAPRQYYRLATLLRPLPWAEKTLLWLSGFDRLGAVAGFCRRLLTTLLHLRVLHRAVPMGRLTPYAALSIEAFLPGVRKGVIGGLSNVIWGTRHFGIPFYNCVDPDLRIGPTEFKAGADWLLDVNMQYFGVPFCAGRLTTPAESRGMPVSRPRMPDLVAQVQTELQTPRHALTQVATVSANGT
jgi:hypothetical protein